jgi:hypothetical protein
MSSNMDKEHNKQLFTAKFAYFLQNMPGSLESLFNNETYEAILMASGGVQVFSVRGLNMILHLH